MKLNVVNHVISNHFITPSYNLFRLICCSVKFEQGTVTSLLKKDGTVIGVNYKNKSRQEFTTKAPLTIVCDGCFSNLRSSLCNPKVMILISHLFLSK